MSSWERPGWALLFFAILSCTVLAGDGFGESADVEMGKHLNEVRKRAEKGYPDAQQLLGEAYLTGDGVAQDLGESAQWYEKAARSGNAEAENEIGYFYQKGIGVRADADRAFHWYQLASASGSDWGKMNLAVAYLNGIGVTKNASMALHLFKEAADKGVGLAAAELGTMEYLGIGVPVDRKDGEHWFESGVKLHDPVAAFDLAYLYSDMPAHARDLHRAAELLRFSSSKGYAQGKHALGRLLVNHPELAQSDEEARVQFEQASALGIWQSTAMLGILWRDGKGVDTDAARAYFYFTLSALQGGEPAQRVLQADMQAMEARLPRKELADATAEAQEWLHQHPRPMMFLSSAEEGGRHFHIRPIAEETGMAAEGQ